MPHKDVLGQKYVFIIITEPDDSTAQLFQTIIFVHGAQISKQKIDLEVSRGVDFQRKLVIQIPTLFVTD